MALAEVKNVLKRNPNNPQESHYDIMVDGVFYGEAHRGIEGGFDLTVTGQPPLNFKDMNRLKTYVQGKLTPLSDKIAHYGLEERFGISR